MSGFLLSWAATVPDYAAPLLIAALGLVICEKAGVLNLAPEGVMAVGAMTGALVVMGGQGPWTGLAVGALAGMALSLCFGLAVVVFRADQTLTGLATVAAGLGLSGLFGRDAVQKPFTGLPRFGETGWGADLPRLLGQQNAVIVLALVLMVAVGLWLGRSRAGLRLRAVGEDPAAADVAGVNVQRVQLLAIAASGLLGGLAGAYLSVVSAQVWVEGMIAGRGWIVVALVIFAGWRPGMVLVGALLFGGAEALMPRLQAVGVAFPVYIGAMLPYALTLVVFVVAMLRQRGADVAPAALGRVFLRQDRH
ncbi:ABC transporter permease [Pseudooceanicola sp. CBS1P-1]|uniref:ABC transporter permease n=1 Tax=Pseudooceanicola albus TaxID=2692189 RepID=A0A6L7G7C2_9RHOB|nr:MULTISPECIES: ABC transporter permease [Pseudooceanicola]MBT9386017.1 ABC transporter permease [Pseudooceanicola endophyticus]MXN19562.1 ABC transporter permease [Pseudooceanicola albus]